METAEAHHPDPIPRDADLPDLSDTALSFFAAGALLATAAALVALLD